MRFGFCVQNLPRPTPDRCSVSERGVRFSRMSDEIFDNNVIISFTVYANAPRQSTGGEWGRYVLGEITSKIAFKNRVRNGAFWVDGLPGFHLICGRLRFMVPLNVRALKRKADRWIRERVFMPPMHHQVIRYPLMIIEKS